MSRNGEAGADRTASSVATPSLITPLTLFWPGNGGQTVGADHVIQTRCDRDMR